MNNRTMSIALVALILLTAGITAAAAGKLGTENSRAALQQPGSGAAVAPVIAALNTPLCQFTA